MNDRDIKIYNQGVEEGMKHQKPSSETLMLIRELEQRLSEKIVSVVGAHETKELENYAEVRQLFVDHINETKDLNEAFSNLISGGKVVSAVFYLLVKTVAGIGILATAVYGMKEWLKR